MRRTRKLPEVPEPEPRLQADERLELVFDYLGDVSVDDRSFDVGYLEEEIKEAAGRVETLLVTMRELHHQERLLRMAGTAGESARPEVTDVEAQAVVGEMREEAKARAQALRQQVKDMQWKYGRDLARLEVLRSWWRQAAEDVVVLGEAEDTDAPADT